MGATALVDCYSGGRTGSEHHRWERSEPKRPKNEYFEQRNVNERFQQREDTAIPRLFCLRLSRSCLGCPSNARRSGVRPLLSRNFDAARPHFSSLTLQVGRQVPRVLRLERLLVLPPGENKTGLSGSALRGGGGKKWDNKGYRKANLSPVLLLLLLLPTLAFPVSSSVACFT